MSIVIPAFRAETTLKRTVESCLPEVAPEQIIIVLDGPDAALERVARSSPAGVQVVVLPAQSGAPVCRNTGLGLVNTEHVMFLDADDYVEDCFLASATAAATEAGADLVLGRFSFEMPDGSRQTCYPRERYGTPDCGTILRRWLSGDYTPPCAVVWRSDAVRALGGWDESLAKNQDGDIIYRALMQGCSVTFSSGGQGVYVQDDNPGRITRRHNPRTLGSQLAVLDKIRARLPDLPFDPRKELALAYYSLARLAYSVDGDAVGAVAEDAARALGLAGQPGSMAHTALATVLGLRGKQRMASLARWLIRR